MCEHVHKDAPEGSVCEDCYENYEKQEGCASRIFCCRCGMELMKNERI